MLLTRQRRKSTSPQLNMASMIDVVFLLLIFFMCASSFAKLEDSLRSEVPGSSPSYEVEEFGPVRISLSTTPAGELSITCDGRPVQSFAALRQALRARRAIADMLVIIDGQGAVPYGQMVAALDACHQVGLGRVAFSTRGAER